MIDPKQAATIALIAVGAASLAWLSTRSPELAPYAAPGVTALVTVLVGALRSYLLPRVPVTVDASEIPTEPGVPPRAP